MWEIGTSLRNAVSPPACTGCILHNKTAYTGDVDAWLPWLRSEMLI